jgi:hypothetical protein
MPKSIANLKQIFLDDIDLTEDKVHSDCCLTGTLIEPPSKYVGIFSVFEDDRGQVERIGFYNFPEHYMSTEFTVGRRISIISPYIRTAMDGGTVIRVDAPNTVLFLDVDYEHLCRYCLKSDIEEKLSKCAKCKARYCSKMCQQQDWKTLKHKLICEA